jgi:succinate dehydrogenase / fumarate reductase cytochrome b subunit
MATAKESALEAERRGGLMMKIFSLTGVVPLGVFVVEHLFVNGAALFGERSFVRAISLLARVPAVRVLEGAFVLAPLLVHALMGTYLLVTRKPMTPARPYSRRVTIALRASAVIALAFIAFHVYELRVRDHFTSGEQTFTSLAERLSTTGWLGLPLIALFYLAGTAATALHFVVGLWGYLASSRPSESARRQAAWGLGALGAVLVFLGANTVVCFATGSRFFASGDFAPADLEPTNVACPAPATPPLPPPQASGAP